MRLVRRIVIVIALLAVVSAFVASHLLGSEPVPEQTAYVIDREALRALAQSLPGERPLGVNHQVLALASLPRGAVFAGEPFEPHRMVHGVYQIVYPEGAGAPVLVDAGFSKDYFERSMNGESGQYDADSFAAVGAALRGARAIVITHEHGDHSEGLAHAGDPAALAPLLLLNAAQHADPQTLDALPAALLDAVQPIPGDTPRAIAPGVVLVPAPGHTKGSQLVFVQAGDGREWLLVGDVVWHMDALRNLHYRPRLVTDWFIDEDRAQVLDQIRALHELLDDETLQIVVSHDAEQRRELVRTGVLGDGFE